MMNRLRNRWDGLREREKRIISVGVVLFLLAVTAVWGWLLYQGLAETGRELAAAREELEEKEARAADLPRLEEEYESTQEEWDQVKLRLRRDIDRGALLQEIESIVNSREATLELLEPAESETLREDREIIKVKGFDLAFRGGTEATMDILRLLEDTGNPSQINTFEMVEEDNPKYLELENRIEQEKSRREALNRRKDGLLEDVAYLQEELHRYKMALLFDDLEKEQLEFNDLDRLEQLEDYGIISGINVEELKNLDEYRQKALVEEARDELTLAEIQHMSVEEMLYALEERDALTAENRLEIAGYHREVEELESQMQQELEDIESDLHDYLRSLLLEDLQDILPVTMGHIEELRELEEYDLIDEVNTENLLKLDDFSEEDEEAVDEFEEELGIEKLLNMSVRRLKEELEEREALDYGNRLEIEYFYEDMELAETYYREEVERTRSRLRSYKKEMLFDYRGRGFGLGLDDLDRLEELKEYGIIDDINVEKLALFEDRERVPGRVLDVDDITLEEIRRMNRTELREKLEDRCALAVEEEMEILDYRQDISALRNEIGEVRAEISQSREEQNRAAREKETVPPVVLNTYIHMEFFSLTDEEYREVMEGEAGRKDPFAGLSGEERDMDVAAGTNPVEKVSRRCGKVDEFVKGLEIVETYGVSEGDFFPYTTFAHHGTVSSLTSGEVTGVHRAGEDAESLEEGEAEENYVEIKGDDGLALRYEINEIVVEEGRQVSCGEALGEARGRFRLKGTRLNRTFNVVTVLLPELSDFTRRDAGPSSGSSGKDINSKNPEADK